MLLANRNLAYAVRPEWDPWANLAKSTAQRIPARAIISFSSPTLAAAIPTDICAGISIPALSLAERVLVSGHGMTTFTEPAAVLSNPRALFTA